MPKIAPRGRRIDSTEIMKQAEERAIKSRKDREAFRAKAAKVRRAKNPN